LHSTTRKLSIDSGGEDGELETKPGKATRNVTIKSPRDFKIHKNFLINYSHQFIASLLLKLRRVNADVTFTTRQL
jgi:hypothetical protein